MKEPLFQSEYPVTDEQVAFFRENGYVRFDDVLRAEEVAVVRRGVDRGCAERKGFVRDLAGGGEDGDRPKDRILQMLNLWELYPGVHAYVFGGRIARMARRLTGSPTIHLYHDQALIKEPGPSAPSPWHQDQPYWPSREPGMLSCWMALDDVTVERGCMQFIPGSHTWGEFPPISFKEGSPALREYLSDEQHACWKPVPVELKAGSCTFHHGLTFHYTNANTTDHIRRALVTIYIPEGVTYAAGDKMDNPFSDTITSRKGAPLRGARFPRLV
jgi:ectoine hydroxylase-related dioxygenase (phytanoyl-CoA dioxygenase family)